MKINIINSILALTGFSAFALNSTENLNSIAMEKITFKRDSLTLSGHLYLPAGFDDSKTYPAVVVGGSLTSVKEQMSGTYASKLAEEGILALDFDFSHYGESEGLPRQFEDPNEKLRDLKAAVTYLESLPYVDEIGALGVCTSGGNVAYLAAEDKRIKAMVTVAAWLPNDETLPLLYGGDENLAALRAAGSKAVEKYKKNGENTIITAYSNTDKTASHFGPMEYYMDSTRGGGVAAWKNEFSVMSWETWLSFDPMSKAANISIPTMVIHSDGSALPENAKKFFEAVQGEKELKWLEGYHFDFYDQEKQVREASQEAANFFKIKL